MSTPRLPPSAVSVLIVLGFAALILAACSTLGMTGVLAGGVAIPLSLLALICLQRPMLFISIAALWYGLAFFSSPTYFPGIYNRFSIVVRFMDEVFLLPLFLVVLLRIAFRKKIPPTRIALLWALFLIVGILSGLMNGSAMKSVFSYEQAYTRHIILLLAGSSYFKRRAVDYKVIVVTFTALLLLQFVLNAAWWFGINPIPNIYYAPGVSLDWAVGSLGSTSYVTYLSVVGLSLVIVGLQTTQALSARVGWCALAAVAVMLILMGHTKHALPIAGASLFFVVFTSRKGHYAPKAAALIVFILGLSLAAKIINRPFAFRQDRWYEPVFLETVSVVKRQAYVDVARVLTQDKKWILGAGPGRLCSVAAKWNRAPLFMKHFYHELEKERYNPQGSIMLYPRTGLLSILGETGILGLALYGFIYGLVFARIFGQFRDGAYDVSVWARRMAVCWCSWAVFFAILNCLTDYLNFGITPFLTWAGAGVLWLPPKDENESEETQSPVEEPAS